MDYWDSSALLKLYVPEPDSAGFIARIAQSQNPICSSSIAAVEILCVLHRKERAAELGAGSAATIFARFLADVERGKIERVPFGDDVLSHTVKVVALVPARARPTMIRSLDAIHIASALSARAGTVITTDVRLGRVAQAAGLRVQPRIPGLS